MSRYSLGVSAIICCHSSASRLPHTLDHLARQQCSPDLPWEVIVVDNASTDGTSEAAYNLWPADPPIPLRVVQERKLGLNHARERGLSEARYEYIVFVDDDNWLCPGWVQTVAAIFKAHPEVGMLSGRGDPVFECPPPPWFSQYERWFVVGAPADSAGFIRPDFVYGAGMCLRHSAWDSLRSAGFRFILADRRGNSLSTSGDVELMLAISFMGWKAWYEPQLQFRHYLPSGRLTTRYLRRLTRAVGMSWISIGMYQVPFLDPPSSALGRLRQMWVWQLQSELRALLRVAVPLLVRPAERRGVASLQAVELQFGRVLGLALMGPIKFRTQRKTIQRLYLACRDLKLTGCVATANEVQPRRVGSDQISA